MYGGVVRDLEVDAIGEVKLGGDFDAECDSRAKNWSYGCDAWDCESGDADVWEGGRELSDRRRGRHGAFELDVSGEIVDCHLDETIVVEVYDAHCSIGIRWVTGRKRPANQVNVAPDRTILACHRESLWNQRSVQGCAINAWEFRRQDRGILEARIYMSIVNASDGR